MTRLLSRHTVGMIEILISGICFGVLGVFGKFAFRAGLTPGELLSLRYLIAAVILGGAFLLIRPSALRLPFRSIMACAALGIFGYAVFSSCFFEALQGLSASTTVLLLYTYPVVVSLGAWAFLKQRLSVLGWIALPVVSIGMVLLVWGGGDIQPIPAVPLLFGLASAVFYSVYILGSSRVLQNINPFAAVMYVQAFAGIALGSLHLHHPSHVMAGLVQGWPAVLGAAVLSTVIAMSLFISGLQKLKAAEASVLSTAEPITGVIAAILFLGERLSLAQVAGAVLVLTSMILITRQPRDEIPMAAAVPETAS